MTEKSIRRPTPPTTIIPAFHIVDKGQIEMHVRGPGQIRAIAAAVACCSFVTSSSDSIGRTNGIGCPLTFLAGRTAAPAPPSGREVGQEVGRELGRLTCYLCYSLCSNITTVLVHIMSTISSVH